MIRPGGGMKYWSLLVNPMESSQVSKTGENDVSMLLDSPYLQWIGPMLEKIKSEAGVGRVFPFSYLDYVETFRRACKAVGMKNVVPYQLRHSGASHDRAHGLRDALSTKLRGQWKAESSMKRYEKHGRLAHSLSTYSHLQRIHFEACERRISDIVLWGKTLDTPRQLEMLAAESS